VDKKYEKRINKMCVKFSIIPDPKKTRRMSDSIDVDFLVKNFTRSKSREYETSQIKTKMRKSIKEIAGRHEPKAPKPFFALNYSNLRQI
jgi:hypothetical protein